MYTELKWQNPIENKNPANTHQIIQKNKNKKTKKTNTHQTVDIVNLCEPNLILSM